jgi:hypothetical protein
VIATEINGQSPPAIQVELDTGYSLVITHIEMSNRTAPCNAINSEPVGLLILSDSAFKHRIERIALFFPVGEIEGSQ